jgi:hypothetical protein
VGSLEAGKDADIAIWSGNPLSTYSICEQTWVDGRKYFDRDEDARMNEEVRKERSTLIKKVVGAKGGSGEKKGPTGGQGDEKARTDEVIGREGR